MNEILQEIYEIRKSTRPEIIDRLYCNKFTFNQMAKDTINNPTIAIDLAIKNTVFGIEILIREEILDWYLILENRNGTLTTLNLQNGTRQTKRNRLL